MGDEELFRELGNFNLELSHSDEEPINLLRPARMLPVIDDAEQKERDELALDMHLPPNTVFKGTFPDPSPEAFSQWRTFTRSSFLVPANSTPSPPGPSWDSPNALRTSFWVAHKILPKRSCRP